METKEKIFVCEKGHEHKRTEMIEHYCFGYHQLVCPECRELMFDELYGHQYCTEKKV